MKFLVIGLGRINVQNKDGGAIRLYNFLEYLSKSKHSIELLIVRQDKQNFISYKINAYYHVIIDYFPTITNIFIIYMFRTFQACLYTIFKNISADIIYCASDFFHDFIPSLLYKLTHINSHLIVCMFLLAPSPGRTYETMYEPSKTLFSLKLFLYYLSQRITIFLSNIFSDGIFVLNELDRSTLLTYGVSRHKIFVVSMGVNIKQFAPRIHQKKSIEACYIGRLHPQKGVKDLVPIWKKVTEKLAHAKLVIISGGSQEDQQYLRDQIVNSEMQNNIQYVGYKDGIEKVRILHKCKLLLVPSYYESFGQVVLEGLSSGLIVISYQIPVFQSLFKNVITMVQYKSIEQFSAKIVAQLNSYKKNNYSTFLRAFDWEEVCKKELDIFTTIYEK